MDRRRINRYLDLVVTSSPSQWPCLQITVLVDTRKECGSNFMTFAADADPLRKIRLLSIFSVNLLRGADIGYLALRPLSD